MQAEDREPPASAGGSRSRRYHPPLTSLVAALSRAAAGSHNCLETALTGRRALIAAPSSATQSAPPPPLAPRRSTRTPRAPAASWAGADRPRAAADTVRPLSFPRERSRSAPEQHRLPLAGGRRQALLVLGEPLLRVVLRDELEEGVLARDHLVDAEAALLLEALEQRPPDEDEQLVHRLGRRRHRQHQPQRVHGKDELLLQRGVQRGHLHLPLDEGEVLSARGHVGLERLFGDRRTAVVDVAAVLGMVLSRQPGD